MIVTNCPHCEHPALYTVKQGQYGVYIEKTCPECGGKYIVEVTRTDGTTYTKEHFVNNILSGLDDVTRNEHPTSDVAIYCDSSKSNWV